MVDMILGVFLDTFYWFFSPMELDTNFFQAGFLLFLILLIVGFFLKGLFKSI